MAIHYCLGLRHGGVAPAVYPVNPVDLAIDNLREELNGLAPALSFEEVIDIPSFTLKNRSRQARISWPGSTSPTRRTRPLP